MKLFVSFLLKTSMKKMNNFEKVDIFAADADCSLHLQVILSYYQTK